MPQLLRKSADLGGEPEQQFEVAFSQLALAYIQDAAPELVDRMLGFQLVDRNDDKTKAFGVFGFDLGGQMAYAPVIFINGEIKGNELLFLPQMDMFVPLSEKWTNYLLSQGTSSNLGSSAIGSPQELGMMPPNISPIVRPPIMAKRGNVRQKLANAMKGSVPSMGWHPDLKPFAPLYGALTYGSLDDGGSLLLRKSASLSTGDLLNKLLRESPGWVKLAMDICDRYPAIDYYWKKFHGADVFESALLDQQARYKNASDTTVLDTPAAFSVNTGYRDDVHMITEQNSYLSEKQASLLARQGYVIEDQRPMKKLSAAAVRYDQKVANPTETGIYELLTNKGTFTRAFVVIGPKGQSETKGTAFAKQIDGDAFVITDPSNMFVRLPSDSKEEFKQWFEGLGGSDLSTGSDYVCVTKTMEGSVAFSVNHKRDNDVYDVYSLSSCGCSGDLPDYMLPAFEDGEDYKNRFEFRRKRLEAVRKWDGSKFRFYDGVLEIPNDAKTIKLGGGDPIELGVPTDMDIAVQEKTASLRVRVDGFEASINRAPRITKLAAMYELMHEHGLNEEQSRIIIKNAEAASRAGEGYTVRVAYGEAYPYSKKAFDPNANGGGNLSAQGISSPGFPEPQMSYTPWSGGTQEQAPMEHQELIGGMGAMNNDPATYDPSVESGAGQADPAMLQQAQQAGQSGQKELFDTSMLSSMAKGMRPQSRTQEWTRDLIKAMDRLGRILLLFYWHNEEFADRYGKNDLPDLEDAIRNAFDAVGEVTLYLKEKDIEPLGGLQSGEANVDQSAG